MRSVLWILIDMLGSPENCRSFNSEMPQELQFARLNTMHSILRELFRQIPSYLSTSTEPEERLTRPVQYRAGQSWNVDTIETFSLIEHRKVEPAHLWNLNLACVDPESYKPYSVEFNYFLDGTQRTSRIREIRWQAKGFGTVPMLVAQIFCTVLSRENRALAYCERHSKSKTLVEAPIKFLARNSGTEVSKAFQSLQTHPSFQWVDTSYETQQSDEPDGDSVQVQPLKGWYHRISDAEFKDKLADPHWLCNQARKWTTKYRDALEQSVFDELAENFGRASEDGHRFGLFLKDGTLTSIRGKFINSAVGVSKSFNTRFLAAHQQEKVVNLPGFHRTPVFKFQRDARGTEPDEVEAEEAPKTKSPQKHTVVSWYIRIRPPSREVPYWGLLRIEIHPNLLPCSGSADRWTDADSRLISAISAALIAEANPTSHPDPRWHNLIYPVTLCERFARSRMIPHETVRHLFMWGGSRNE